MALLVAIPPIILAATSFLAQSSGSDAAVAGMAGLMGMLGVFGFVVALIYSIVLFFLPFVVWKCLRRLTSIRDDIRGFRQEIKELATRTSAVPLTATAGASVSPPPATAEQYQMNDISKLQRLVKENEKGI